MIPSAQKLEQSYLAGALTLMPFETLLLPYFVFNFGKISPAPAATFFLTDPSVHTSKSNSPRAAMVASVAVFFSSSVELFVQLVTNNRKIKKQLHELDWLTMVQQLEIIASFDCADHTLNHPVPSSLFSFCHSSIGTQDLD